MDDIGLRQYAVRHATHYGLPVVFVSLGCLLCVCSTDYVAANDSGPESA